MMEKAQNMRLTAIRPPRTCFVDLIICTFVRAPHFFDLYMFCQLRTYKTRDNTVCTHLSQNRLHVAITPSGRDTPEPLYSSAPWLFLSHCLISIYRTSKSHLSQAYPASQSNGHWRYAGHCQGHSPSLLFAAFFLR